MGSQAGVGGGQPRSPFRVSLLVAESSDKWRGLREKNEAEMGLNHFAPSWITNPPTKEAPTLHFSRESRRGAEAGRRGLQARLGKPRPSGILSRCPPARPVPHGPPGLEPEPLPRLAAAWNPDLGPLLAPCAQRCHRFYFILLFCPINWLPQCPV